MRPRISEEERVEIHAGLELRLDQLKKLKKGAEEAGLHAAIREIDEHVTVIRGKDGDPGLLSKFVDQTTLDFDGGKKQGNDDDLFDGADRSSKNGKTTATTEGEAPAEDVEFEVLPPLLPPPKADDVTSLVPRN